MPLRDYLPEFVVEGHREVVDGARNFAANFRRDPAYRGRVYEGAKIAGAVALILGAAAALWCITPDPFYENTKAPEPAPGVYAPEISGAR